jgi:CRP/FNR family transcriptional regulator, cyclic AMP receptor protein
MIELESNKLFRDLSPEDMKLLRGATRESTFEADQIIFSQGDPGDGIYFVKDGSVLISTTVSTGDSKVLTKIGPGEMFGEMAVVDDEPRSASAMAERKRPPFILSAAPNLLKLHGSDAPPGFGFDARA